MRSYWFNAWSALAISLALGVPLHAEFACVVNASSTILGYMINPDTGTLTAIAGSPFAGGAGQLSAVVDPSGKFQWKVVGYSEWSMEQHGNTPNGLLSHRIKSDEMSRQDQQTKRNYK